MLPPLAAANGKHSTMDSATQNMALQQLRGSVAAADAQTRLMSLQERRPATVAKLQYYTRQMQPNAKVVT